MQPKVKHNKTQNLYKSLWTFSELTVKADFILVKTCKQQELACRGCRIFLKFVTSTSSETQKLLTIEKLHVINV
jgi:hypothetical protein